MPSIPGVINFPATLDDVISLVEANNHASATLTAGITNSVLLIPVSQPSEFSNSGYATILDTLINPTTIEIVRYTSKSGSDLVVPAGGRGQQGTAAAAFSSGAPVEQRPTARHHTVLADVIIALEGAMRTNTYTSTNSNTIANTAAATSIFTGGSTPLTGSSGSSLVIPASSVRVGTVYRLRIFGSIQTTGTPTLQAIVKLGSAIVANAGAATMATINGRFWIDVDLQITAIGATGSVTGIIKQDNSSVGAAAATITTNVGANVTVVDFTAAQTIDVTFQWGTASPSNTLTVLGVSIERVR